MTNPSNQPDTDQNSLEIERVFLLNRLPDLPTNASKYTLIQGYLPESDSNDTENPIEGRLRQTTNPDGTITYTHTIKKGLGLIRNEIEREITQQEFEENWHNTQTRRLSKTRYLIKENDQIWAVDDFHNLKLILAEIELPTPETQISLPDWLKNSLIREVTEEPAYRSYFLAIAKNTPKS